MQVVWDELTPKTNMKICFGSFPGSIERFIFFFLSCAKLEGKSGRRILQSSSISLPHGLLSRNYADKVKKWFILPPTDADVQEAHNISLTG